MDLPALEIRVINTALEQALTDFFQALREARDREYFHPHPFTAQEAQRLSRYEGRDLYYALFDGKKILGYGLLRGWDEGYDIPSLGIAIHPTVRGLGLGKLLMQFLHAAARQRGARKIRLKVYPDNVVAVTLYRRLGYEFQAKEAEQLVGFIDL